MCDVKWGRTEGKGLSQSRSGKSIAIAREMLLLSGSYQKKIRITEELVGSFQILHAWEFAGNVNPVCFLGFAACRRNAKYDILLVGFSCPSQKGLYTGAYEVFFEDW